MSGKFAGRIVMGVAGLTMMAGSAAGQTAGMIRVRVYDYAGVKAEVLRQARQEMRVTFAAAGVAMVSEQCTVGKENAAENRRENLFCAEPVGAEEITVRVLGEGSLTGEKVSEGALGYAVVGENAARGVMATVLAERTQRLAARAGVEFGWLLGKVMAHEVAHLVMGSKEHTGSGLMRAGWKEEEIRKRRVGEWSFHKEQKAEMRRAMQADCGGREEIRLATLKERR